MRSLFDRICEPTKSDFLSDKESAEIEIESIDNELNRLLNTRSYFVGRAQRYGRTIADYGLSDLVSAGAGPLSKLEEVNRNVSQVVNSYEPRLVDIHVSGNYVPNYPQKVVIHIKGKLKSTRAPFEFKVPLVVTGSNA